MHFESRTRRTLSYIEGNSCVPGNTPWMESPKTFIISEPPLKGLWQHAFKNLDLPLHSRQLPSNNDLHSDGIWEEPPPPGDCNPKDWLNQFLAVMFDPY